jgi:hypothetical protein
LVEAISILREIGIMSAIAEVMRVLAVLQYFHHEVTSVIRIMSVITAVVRV